GGPLLGMITRGQSAGDTGVKNGRPAQPVEEGAAGNDMFPSSLIRRPKRDGQVLPTDQVATSGVAPMHASPLIAVRIVLVKHVVITPVINRAVRIVHPVSRAEKMERWPGGIVADAPGCVAIGRHRPVDGRLVVGDKLSCLGGRRRVRGGGSRRPETGRGDQDDDSTKPK